MDVSSMGEEKLIETRFTQLHYIDWGEVGKPTIVLLHHVGSQAHTWDVFAASMSKDFRLLALDLRGHGDSFWASSGFYTINDYMHDVVTLVQSIGLEKIVLVGGSLGGRVGLVYAALHPDQVAGLILEDVGPTRPPDIAERLRERVLRETVGEFLTLDDIVRFLRETNSSVSEDVHLHNAKFAASQDSAGLWHFKRDPKTSEGFVPLDLWEYVEMIQSPVLMMVGEKSPIVPTEVREKMVRILPRSEIDVIPNAGHLIVHEQPELFMSSVRGFLQKIRF